MSPSTKRLIPLAAFVVISLIVIGIGGWRHFSNEPPLPPPPPVQAKPNAVDEDDRMRQTARFFQSLVKQDAKRFGVSSDITDLAKPFAYSSELPKPTRLLGRDGLSTKHLEIKARIEKQWTDMAGGQGFGADQFLLTIRNKTQRYLIYRVETDVPDPRMCRSLGALGHNAIALKPQEEVTRAECLWSRGFALFVKKVEVIEVPAISYYYVSQLHPPHVLYTERTSRGHQVASGKLCELLPWRVIGERAQAGDIEWSDVLDFYARHSCAEYQFFPEYRRRKSADEPLPATAQPQEAAEPASPGSRAKGRK